MTRHELILYATPGGLLGEQCRRFFDRAGAEFGPTTAQRYPAHVTLTGFFRRPAASLGRIIDEFDRVVGSARPGRVSVTSLTEHGDWVGLEIESEPLKELARAFSVLHRVGAGDDGIRLKDWLHLSLAYGSLPDGVDIGQYTRLARQLVSPMAPVAWQVGLWERSGDRWTCLSSTELNEPTPVTSEPGHREGRRLRQ